MLNPGDPAPTFNLSDQNHHTHSLSDYQGKWVVVYFYPADDTPGCTKEACSFRDEKGRLEEMGAVVLGVSADGVESHGAFANKFGLNFPLLADTQHQMIKAYGAWGMKNVYGKEFEGILRKTFIVNPQGKIAKIWEKVNAEGHAVEVAEALSELQR